MICQSMIPFSVNSILILAFIMSGERIANTTNINKIVRINETIKSIISCGITDTHGQLFVRIW